MKIGFLTSIFADEPFPDTVKWAGQHGFEILEVGCAATPSDTYYNGSNFYVPKITKSCAQEIKELLNTCHLEISCLTYCDNMLDADSNERRKKSTLFKKTIDAAAALGVNTVSGFVGAHQNLPIHKNIAEFKKVFTPLVKYASDKGVRIAIENCPMPGWYREGVVGNIAFSPYIWEMMFNEITSDNLGLNYDPSHLVWLAIDYLGVLETFAEKIFHTHMKDTEILYDRLNEMGVINYQQLDRWWHYRLPGLGELDWKTFISKLGSIGYDAALSIEHEDPVWSGSTKKVKKGLLFAQKYLNTFIV